MSIDYHPNFYSGWNGSSITYRNGKMYVGTTMIMAEWERPLMERIAAIVCERNGDVLEVGFGMGISASCIQKYPIRAHTIIEPHPGIFEQATQWKASYKDADIRLVKDTWQNYWESLDKYDSIFLDAWAPEDSIESDTFEFFRIAACHLLKPNGLLVFWYGKPFLTEHYQRGIMKYFNQVTLERFSAIEIPREFGPFYDHMLIPAARL